MNPFRPKTSAPELIVLPEADGQPALPFLLVRDRFHTLRITVKPDGSVTVKAPARTRAADILAAVEGRRAWIEAKRAFFRQRPQPEPRRYADGETFYYLGRPFRLRLLPTDGLSATDAAVSRTSAAESRRPVRLPSARLSGRELVVTGTDLTPDRVRKALETWRQRTALRLLGKRLPRLHAYACQVLGDSVPLPALNVRSLKRRWGSCSVRGEITLARQLSAVPLEGVDYVILHELCHLRRMDHSPHFHALLDRLLPDARDRAQRLHVWGLEHAKD